MDVIDKIKQLTRQLLPTGRAFKMALDSELQKLNDALAESEKRAWDDMVSIKDSMLPDNDNFTVEDARFWERVYGLISNEDISLDDRKLAIARKMNHPGSEPARQTSTFLQAQLRAAGFDVYVYENRFDDGMGGFETHDPVTFFGAGDQNQLDDHQLGDAQMGSGYSNLIANYIEQEKDAIFDVGANLRSTFFIGGTPAGQFADVLASRKAEFRELIHHVKPRQTVGYLGVNYI